MSRPVTSLAERFWPKVDKAGPTPDHAPNLGPCWIWTGATAKGYGVIGRGGRGAGNAQAHRVAYELIVGPIPEGSQLDHLCRVRACVNPHHAEPVTNRENTQRGARGRLVTVCAQGHPYTPENTWYRKEGRRQCRACWRARREARAA